MDGSNSAFLYDAQFSSSREDDYAGGILYVEDFGGDPCTRESAISADEPAAAPSVTQVDLEFARAEGRAEGLRCALADAAHTRAQLETAALQSLADSLGSARVAIERVAADHAGACVRALLAMMSAAVPAAMARYAEVEMQAMLDVLLPGLACEPELRVRTHPDLANIVREHLGERLPTEGIILSVVADTRCGLGDVEVSWQHGRARRDCNAIWQAIRSAMTPMSLPTIEELCFANGS